VSSIWVVLPVVVPLLAAVALLCIESAARPWLRTASMLALAGNLVVALVLVQVSAGTSPALHALGDWAPPFGIVLMADRLAASMVLLTAVVVLAAAWQSVLLGADLAGRYYHALLQIQLMGLNGAFLTGDFFNLFVFFEVLLLASYGLLLHGGAERLLRPGLHYVVINLFGSALFLVGVSLVYGASGTLNMADFARRLPGLDAQATALSAAGCAVLALVFALKAAVGPLGLWLPGVYTRLPPGIATLFSLMTKVGVYALLRLSLDVISEAPVEWLAAARSVLFLVGLLAVAMATVVLLGARRLSALAAGLVLASSGTLIASMALAVQPSVSACLYYLVHSTLAAAVLFAVVDLLRVERPLTGDEFASSETTPPALRAWLALGLLAASGLPPFSGFVAKLVILQGSQASAAWYALWVVVLVAGLATLARCAEAWLTIAAVQDRARTLTPVMLRPVAVLALLGLGFALAASPFLAWSDATALQLSTAVDQAALEVQVTPRAGAH
jgi:multicomponent K+:H+ antiporter subunit D